jgi:hypothetical protein
VEFVVLFFLLLVVAVVFNHLVQNWIVSPLHYSAWLHDPLTRFHRAVKSTLQPQD